MAHIFVAFSEKLRLQNAQHAHFGWSKSSNQSHFIEVAQGAILMEQSVRFGPFGSAEKKIGL